MQPILHSGETIHGWLATNDDEHMAIVAEYFGHAGGWSEPSAALVTPPGPGDRLYAVWATAERR